MDIAIVGAGITGLTAAYDLTRLGHSVSVFEMRPHAGGLAAGFRDERWEWPLDRFYHHWFASDEHVIGLIDELGLGDRLFFRWPTTSLMVRGHFYPLDSPIPALRSIPVSQLHRAVRVLQFTPLPVNDRLRVGLAAFYLTLTRDWQRLERITADEWLRRAVGERAYKIWWKPLLVSKFGEENYRDVNMAWLWARAYKRTARLGYFAGGFQGFVDVLVARVCEQGGDVRLASPVSKIRTRASGRLRLATPSGPAEYDRVIATGSPWQTLQLVPEMPAEYADRLRGLKSMGAVVLILALKRPITEGHYWINIPAGEGLPFMGLIEHTNFISPEHYGGDHLVYCGEYLETNHARLHCDKEQLLSAYLPGLKSINSEFSREWVRATWMFTEPYAQPIPTLNHSRNLPPSKTPVSGLWMANMSLVYPWDRGSNYAIELGRRVAREVIE